MNIHYAWRGSSLMLVLCLVTLAVLTSCGGKGNVDGTNLGASASGAPVVAGETRTIGEDEISNLPAWQQDLLADPGWNQPTIPQRADTPMPAPSYEQLLDWQTKAQAAAATAVAGTPRAGADGKSSSWTAGTPTTGLINRGEYNLPFSQGGTVPYGCKDSNGTNGHMKEKKLALEPIPQGANQALTFVEKGVSASNHFNSTGGASNNALCAVYQLWSNKRTADPTQPYSATSPTIAEVSYRADGGPAAGGQPCNTPAAYTVRDFIWWKYNITTFNALPGMNTTALYNILIAPSSNASAQGTSAGPTVGRIQNFYCGSLSSSYGGGAMVTLDSSTNACALFANSVTSQPMLYTNPIYGVLLKRWQDSVLKSMNPPNNNPWNGDFGWPVQGPVPYNNGAQTLTGNGAYYAWGMYFERGFMWWIDYINNTNVPDEAQAYSYTGSNVFCKSTNDKYEKLSTIFYGGGASSPLGVSVIVEASLNPDRGAGSPPAGTFYEVSNPASPSPARILDMHAHGYGGTPRSTDGRYKYYTWAFRDGTIGVTNGSAFDDSTKYLTHSYVTESVYTIRVQVVDNNGAVGYGDSLPVHVGTGGGSANAEIWLIRMDSGAFNTNYDAIKTSLDAINAKYGESDFSASTATDFLASATSKVAIFYRGGPGGSESTKQNTAWTQAQYDAIRTILSSGTKRRVLLFSQNNQTGNPTSSPYHYYYPFLEDDGSYWYYYPLMRALGGSSPYNAESNTADYTEFEEKIDGEQALPYAAYSSGGDYYQAMYNYSDPGQYDHYCFLGMRSTSWTSPLPYMTFGAYATNAAERYAGAGSSGKVPVSLQVTASKQYAERGYWTFSNPPYNTRNSGFTAGLGLEESSSYNSFRNQALVSYGNSTAPGLTAGTGKFWAVGYSWKDMAVTAGTASKDNIMQNMLAWLDSSLTFTAKTNGGFQEYSGTPEIVSVTPAYWDETNHNYVTGGPTAPWNGTGANTGRYPDQTSTDMYRNSGGPANAVITTDYATSPFTNNNNWINGNDVDFQQTMYAYIDRGVNSTLETGGVTPTWNNTDDSVFYAGVLASDADLSWARVTPAATPSIMLKEQANNTLNRNPAPVVCGYYQTTGAGSTADDIYAGYGTETDAFTATANNWTNDSPLQVECLARWPQTLKYFNWTGPGGQAPNAPDAYLTWQVYPGQGNMIVTGPNAGKFIGLNANWEESRSSFDVDKSFSLPARTGTGWNRPSFAFQDAATAGRNINFNFRKLPTWNGDQNRDGVLNTNDKFPVRVRLFTDHQTYYSKTVNPGSGWPNHLSNPGKDPATTPVASRNPSFIEAGTYVIDKGNPVYPLQVQDDTAAGDPGAPGTISGQGPGSYTVRLQFELKYGVANYKIEADTWYAGSWGTNSGVAPVLVKDFATAPNTTGLKDYTISVPAAQPTGTYTMAIRVTDQASPTPSVSTFVWPSIVNLVPQQLFQDDFNNLSNWTGVIPMGSNSGGQSWSTIASTLCYPSGTLTSQNGSGSFATPVPTSGTSYNNYYNNSIQLTNAINIPAGQAFTMSFYTAGYAETGWDGLVAQVSFDNGATWTGHEIAGFWNNYYGNANGFQGYNGFTLSPVYTFSSGNSANGTGPSWVQHTHSFASAGSARQMKIRFWFCSDSSVTYYPGVVVDSLLLQ